MADDHWIRLVGLQVIDPDGYARYRAAMAPILERFGGHFGYDFTIAEVLRSEVSHPINRVFTLVFPSQEALHGFFRDREYLRVRAMYFEPAVRHTVTIAEARVDSAPVA